MKFNYLRAKRPGFGAIVLPGFFAMTVAVPGNAADQAATIKPTEVVEEVVVSGLRPLRLQDTPLAVSIVAASDLVNSGFKEPKDLQFLSPSIQVSLQGANAIYIRGSGTNSQDGGTDQSVGLVVDGVAHGFVDDIGGDMSDLDHVEVYRGPQGTQFGKNASAGVLAIVTRKPQLGVYSLDAKVSYGEHDDTSNSITANFPIGSTMAGRVTGSYQYRDGVFKNLFLNQTVGAREQKAFRAKFLWEPGDTTSALLSMDYRDTFEQPNFPHAWAVCSDPGPVTPYVNFFGTNSVPPCFGALGAGVVPSLTNTDSSQEELGYRNTQAGGVSLQLDRFVGDYKLTSISAWRTMDRELYSSGIPATITQSGLWNDYRGDQYSQEFRFTSPEDQTLTYVAGLFWYKRSTINEILRAGEYYGEAFYKYPDTPFGMDVMISREGGRTRTRHINESYAAFVDGAWHLTDRLQLNGGFRATRDDVSGVVRTLDTPGVYPSTVGGSLKPDSSLTVKNTGYTYRFGPQFFLTPDIQFFATFAHGYKGPIVDTVAAFSDVALEIKPEEVDMIEAGFKAALLQGRAHLNVTAFHQEFENYQVVKLNESVNPSRFQLGNAEGLRSKGVEIEAVFAPNEHWVMGGALSYIDAKYMDLIVGCWTTGPITPPTTGKNGCYVRPGTTTPSANAVDTQLINSSKWTYRLNLGYTNYFLDGYQFDADAIYQHRSDFLSQVMDPNVVNPGYGVLNLTAGVTTPSGRTRIGVFARNALEEYFRAGTQPMLGGYTIVLNPESVRTVGVQMSVSF